jgi:DNA-binding transcriptional MerR regulator
MPSIENQTLSKLYYSIGEVAEMLQVNASLLRFWEKEFNLVVSKKNKKGNRLFSVKEIEQIKRIYHFVKIEGYTLDGAKKALKQKGAAPVQVLAAQETTKTQVEHVSKTDHSDLIARLEGIKAKLLQLPVQKETAPIQTPTPILQEMATPATKNEPTPTAITPPKKRSVEKPKPASDMPTLFDF